MSQGMNQGMSQGMRRLPRLLAAPLVGLLLLTGCSSESPKKAAVAEVLPDISLAAFGSGRPLDLGSLKGPAVLSVWASWCGPCRKELPQFQAFSQKYAGKVRVVGVDFQDTRLDAARALIRETGVRYPLFADPGGKIRARALPELILVDASGKVAYRQYVEIQSVAQLEQLVRTHLGADL
jgi:cytochrome c biogenesis protein CcmG/thiol:disulfide interchange protein DsbE